MSPKEPVEEVDLWVVEVGTASDDVGKFQPASANLDPLLDRELRRAATTADERERASHFRSRHHAELFLSAHGALRLILARYLARDPRALTFTSGASGKPALEGESLEFNLSHSGELALIAVARNRRVGVDVETLRALPELLAIAARVCSPRELATLDAMEPRERDFAFLTMWTRKEALAKMTGEGVRALARDVHLDDQGDCKLVPLQDLPGYAACVAAEGTTWSLKRRL